MARKRKPARGPRGRTGARGERGERGEPGANVPRETIDRLTAELEAAQRDLRVQFTRIAQLQTELDSLRAALKNNAAEK